MWSPKEAEERIHAYVETSPDFTLSYMVHAGDRMRERGITTSDIMYVLKNGYIDEEPQKEDRPGHFKYKMCGRSPNTGSREICLIVIPDPDKPTIEVVTVMWKDM